jgi:beta-glucuronidase
MSQKSPLIINVDNRKKLSLNGKWQTIIDLYDTGYYDSHMAIEPNGFFKNEKPKDKSDRIEYEFLPANNLLVPGDWNTQKEKLYYYESTVWYKKDFDYKLPKGRRLFVYFGGANYITNVYCNGEKLGDHEGGYTPFNFEITELVNDKDNFIIARVNAERKNDAVPMGMTDWYNYGGITRRVMLIDVPETFIKDYFIQLKKGSFDNISGWIQLDGPKTKQKITVEIPEVGVQQTVVTNDDGYAKIELTADLELWSPENPKLYEVVIKAETDELKDQIGFRSIETKGQDILLNGKSIFLRGICFHEESPFPNQGRASRMDEAEILFGWAKELNCNFVRLAHYTHNENMTRAADRLGILIWAEIPVYWNMAWENEATRENAKNQLTEMIHRDKNKASVILWSVSNETPVSLKERDDFLQELLRITKQIDPTRLTTAALHTGHATVFTTTQTKFKMEDTMGEHLDVVAFNRYIGWYDALPDHCDKVEFDTIYPDKPHIVSEFGAGGLAGNHGDKMERWTEEFQEYSYEKQLAMYKRIPFLRGTSPWILKDFRTPKRMLPGIQDDWNLKGVVSYHAEKKKAFYILQDFYKKIKEEKEK